MNLKIKFDVDLRSCFNVMYLNSRIVFFSLLFLCGLIFFLDHIFVSRFFHKIVSMLGLNDSPLFMGLCDPFHSNFCSLTQQVSPFTLLI